VAAARRPNLTLAVKRLIRDAVQRLPEFAHIRASRILVVAGEARRASRATIRPAHFKATRRRTGAGRQKPLVQVKGRKILYVITLRPLWFLASTPEERVATVLHELYHASTRFDGTLHSARRHAKLPPRTFSRRVRALRDRYLAEAPEEVVAPFRHRGLVRVRMWLEKPGGAFQPGEYTGRRIYTEKQLFYGVMPMEPPRRSRRGRRRPKGAGATKRAAPRTSPPSAP
jgi:predicted metallopeptidase